MTPAQVQAAIAKHMTGAKDLLAEVYQPVQVITPDGIVVEHNRVIKEALSRISQMKALNPKDAAGIRRIAKDYISWVQAKGRAFDLEHSQKALWARIDSRLKYIKEFAGA